MFIFLSRVPAVPKMIANVGQSASEQRCVNSPLWGSEVACQPVTCLCKYLQLRAILNMSISVSLRNKSTLFLLYMTRHVASQHQATLLSKVATFTSSLPYQLAQRTQLTGWLGYAMDCVHSQSSRVDKSRKYYLRRTKVLQFPWCNSLRTIMQYMSIKKNEVRTKWRLR